MAQRTNSYPIDPNTTSGVDLADLMNQDEIAECSNNSGNTRPGYLTAGGIWTQTAAAGKLNLMLYDGTKDHVIGDNQGSNIVANPAAGSPQAITAGAKTDVPLALNGAAGQTADLFRVGTDKLVVDKSGKVGIGTATPAAAALVVNLKADSIGLQIDKYASQTKPLLKAGVVEIEASGKALHVGNNPFIAGAAGVRFLDIGRVATATAAGSKADFNGDSSNGVHFLVSGINAKVLTLEAPLGFTANFTEYAVGGVVVKRIDAAGNMNVPSDGNLKKDQRPIEDALTVVQKLTGKTFTWKATGAPDAGLIAQEVHAELGDHYAQLPFDDEHGKHYVGSVSYHAVIALLVEALKETSQRLTKLEDSKT